MVNNDAKETLDKIVLSELYGVNVKVPLPNVKYLEQFLPCK